MPRLLTTEQLEALRAIDTPTICNAIETFGVRDRTEGFWGYQIRSISPQLGTLCGYAVTAEVDASTPGAPGNPETWGAWVDAMSAAPKPGVLIFKDVGPDPVRSAHCGEVMATLALRLGMEGLVTDGGVRDLFEVEQLGFRYFAAGLVPAHGTTRFIRVSVPVTIGGITVHPGDLIHGDVNGVTTIPWEIAPFVVEAALKIRQKEAGVLAFIKGDSFEPNSVLRRLFTH